MSRRLEPARRQAALLTGLVAVLVLLAAAVATSAPPASAGPPAVAARSAILIDRVTGRVLWSRSPDRRLPEASCTKIMTLLVVLEHRRDVLDEYFTVTESVAGTLGVGLQPGDRITYREAIRGMIVRSATDCSIALACDVAGTEDRFVVLMNQHAKRWGLTRTHFTNASGALDDPRHLTTARDLARLGRRAMRDADVRQVVKLQQAEVTWQTGVFQAHSENWILRYSWGEGVKPGYTPAAKYCLVAAGQPGSRPLLSVTLHEPTRPRNMADSAALLLWGSSLYHSVTPVGAGDVVARRTLPGGAVLTCVAGASLADVVVRDGAVVRRAVSLTAGLGSAPPAGTRVGTATYRADGEVLGTVDLFAGAPPAAVGTP